jgi:hypothetical protein
MNGQHGDVYNTLALIGYIREHEPGRLRRAAHRDGRLRAIRARAILSLLRPPLRAVGKRVTRRVGQPLGASVGKR